MHIIRPVKITDAMLISTNVPETDAGEWIIGATYALGDVVIVTSVGEHRRYESLQAGNVGKVPKDNPAWWLDVGATLPWKCFDNKSNSQTTAPGYIDMTIQPGKVNALSLMNLEGSRVVVDMVNSGTTVYAKDEAIKRANVTGLYDYFYEPLAYKKTITFMDLPIFVNATIRIRVYGINGGTAKVGIIAVGMAMPLGEIHTEAEAGITDYSTVKTDEFGDSSFIKRDFSKTLDCVLNVQNGMHDYVVNVLSEYRGEPTAWIGVDGFDATTVFGFCGDFKVILKTAEYSICNLQLKGLT